MATKHDLINLVSKKIDYLSSEDVSYAVDLTLDYLKFELAKHNRVEIRGLGSFSIRDRKKAGTDQLYKTVYYRMAKNIAAEINDL